MITIKSKTEIEAMRKAGRIIALIHEAIGKYIKPGVTTEELDRLADEMITQHGATASFKGYPNPQGAQAYPASICASVNDEVVHGIPGSRVLKEGDIVSVDVGTFLNGYHGDAARTFPVGNVSDVAGKLIEVTKQSFFEGIKYAMPGMRVSDISAAIQEYVESKGFSIVRDYVGHGIGKSMHEPPQIPNYWTKERGPRLEAGMTLAIEPMVNEGQYAVRLLDNRWTVVTRDGSLSAHYENTIAVTDKGEPLILTVL